MYYASNDFLKNYPSVYVSHGDVSLRQVCLTFDDGPDNQTPDLLDLLERLGVMASFFVIGRRLEYHSDIARLALSRGHELCMHSYSHTNPKNQTLDDFWGNEVLKSQQLFKDLLGFVPHYYRPPYGEIKPEQVEKLAEENMKIIGWSIDPLDWMDSTEPQHVLRVVETIQNRIHPGAIVLLHDGDYSYEKPSQVVNIISELVPRLKASGYSFVTISEMLNRK